MQLQAKRPRGRLTPSFRTILVPRPVPVGRLTLHLRLLIRPVDRSDRGGEAATRCGRNPERRLRTTGDAEVRDRALWRGTHAKDRVLRRDRLELAERRPALDGEVCARATCHLEISPQDRRPFARIDFLQENGLAPPVPQQRPSAGRPDVRDPSGALAEHRDEIPLVFEVCDDDGERPQVPAAASTDLERRQSLRPDANGVESRLSAVDQTCQPVGAPAGTESAPRGRGQWVHVSILRRARPPDIRRVPQPTRGALRNSVTHAHADRARASDVIVARRGRRGRIPSATTRSDAPSRRSLQPRPGGPTPSTRSIEAGCVPPRRSRSTGRLPSFSLAPATAPLPIAAATPTSRRRCAATSGPCASASCRCSARCA